MSRLPASPNLLPRKSFEELPLLEKLVIFLSSYGRHIIILCQLLVVISFIWRFVLDEQLYQLNQKLNNQIATVKSLATTEADLREIQSKLALVKQIRSNSISIPDVLDTFYKKLPTSISFTTITIKQDKLELGAKTANLLALANLVKNLKQEPSFKEIYLTTARLDNTNQVFSFEISVTL